MDALTAKSAEVGYADPKHYTMASAREKILEHVLIGELLRELWKTGRQDVEVLRTEVDSAGYDLILETGGIVRHIQLKSSYRGAKTAKVDINTALARKPSGCVIWVQFDQHTLELGPFLWFGGAPGQPLPELGDRVARHSRGDSLGTKSARINLRVLSKGKFARLKSIEALLERLFASDLQIISAGIGASARR